MSRLREAARRVDTAWCKGDMRKSEQSREMGDTYCALGALASALLPSDMMLTVDGNNYGTIESVLAFEDPYLIDLDSVGEILDTYEFLESTYEVEVLARVIKDNYRDRLLSHYEASSIDNDKVPSNAIIFTFNDHIDTTREEVVAMMEKADLVLDDERLAQEAEVDEAMEELING